MEGSRLHAGQVGQRDLIDFPGLVVRCTAARWINERGDMVGTFGARSIFDFDHPATITWDTDCDGTPCDAVGAGVILADAAVMATPP
jgi:hypothetical protein